jgi:aryl-alcohol dehydrogenase-like predicted oxidoreductase
MEDLMRKGVDFFAGIEMGIGTWAWGDRIFWGYGKGYGEDELLDAFHACVKGGIRIFDTAEVYGSGQSEIFLGKFLKTSDIPVKIATKFMPFPWRLRKSSLRKFLNASLKRLDKKSIDLYQIHYPYPPMPIEFWMDAMVEVKQAGLIQNVGVSNCDLSQMLRARDALGKEDTELISNQVEYSLLNRKIEKNGLLEECQRSGIKLIAYSPMAMGVLSGKYTSDHPLKGIRSNKYPRSFLGKIQPLIDLMKRIGIEHQGKTPAQVSLNWVIGKGALPIPGAKTVNQASQNLGALGWHLSNEEMQLLDEMSDQVMS